MNYQEIANVNAEIKTIDLKGKSYASVAERVTAFRKLFPTGFITTEIISHDGTTVLMKATAGINNLDGSIQTVLGTGFAQEVRGKGMVNGTSYIENCETSAVGRALGMIGIGVTGSICSAEEFDHADKAREREENAEISSLRCDILLAVNGDIDKLNDDIRRITSDKFTSMDGMNVTQLTAIKKIVSKRYQGENENE